MNLNLIFPNRVMKHFLDITRSPYIGIKINSQYQSQINIKLRDQIKRKKITRKKNQCWNPELFLSHSKVNNWWLLISLHQRILIRWLNWMILYQATSNPILLIMHGMERIRKWEIEPTWPIQWIREKNVFC